MEDNIDEELEARLYAQAFHDPSVEQTADTTSNLPPNLNRQSNKRYFQKNSKNLSTQRNDPQALKAIFPSYPKSKPAPPEPELKTEKEAPITPKTFVPYSSVLSFMTSPPPVSKDEPRPANYEKKKNKPAMFPKNGKLLNPLSKQGVTKGKSAMRLEWQAKKQKATMVRRKAQGRVVTTIELEDSDESDCIPVELPPPPLILLDSSDEETIQKKRALSPSTSSIISDDFIVAGDKRRLVNPFTADDPTVSVGKLRRSGRCREGLEKLKALTKVSSSTSSSDSTRSSSERIDKRKKDRGSLDDDSIYGAKVKSAKQAPKPSSGSSEEEVPCVNARNVNRRRRSVASRNKSTDGEQNEEADENPKPMVPASKRSRFITPSYNDDEFESLISTIVRSGAIPDEEDSNGHQEESQAVTASTIIEDCEIVEQPPPPVIEVPDDDDEKVVSDSEDSMHGFSLPIECDLSLNVTQVPYEPHEYIRNRGETSREAPPPSAISQVDPEVGWNDEMKFFYDGSWGDENFCISSILQAMPRDQKFWKINQRDRVRMPEARSHIRCRKCNEVGHFAAKCNRPKKRVVCFMCGEEGHRETRCPNSICLRCGKPNRLFATVCTACHKVSKKFCPLCNFQGHDIEQCPDKWRRYHSTTTDTGELNSDFRVNELVYCSVCARRGHFAESCSQFLKTISGLITSSSYKITSHKPSYPRIYLQSLEPSTSKKREDEQQLLSLFTYFPSYRFEFKIPRNVRVYPKFLEQFLLHQQRRQAETRALPAIEGSAEKRPKKRGRKRLKATADASTSLEVSLGSDGSRTVSEKASADVHDDSNSNYSFSEFYQPPSDLPEEIFKAPSTSTARSPPEQPKLVKNPFAAALPEYIPLGGNENVPRPAPTRTLIEREPEVVSDGRLMLTKMHFNLLNSIKAKNFLCDLQNRLNIVSAFKWDNTGNSLLITGFPTNQSMFHLELREFLYHEELNNREKLLSVSTKLPRNKVKIVSSLKEMLKSIHSRKVGAVKRLLMSLQDAQRILDTKKALKCRRELNIAFMGQAELNDGGKHVEELRRILFNLEKELKQQKFDVSTELRDEIAGHMKPIFSPMDHGDYHSLFAQYEKVMTARKRKKLRPNPVLETMFWDR